MQMLLSFETQQICSDLSGCKKRQDTQIPRGSEFGDTGTHDDYSYGTYAEVLEATWCMEHATGRGRQSWGCRNIQQTKCLGIEKQSFNH